MPMPRFRLTVPLWPTLFALALCFGAVVTCSKSVHQAINDASRWTDAQGRPLDNAGDGLKCPECGDVLRYQGKYDYRCQKCGLRIQAKYDSVTGQITFSH